MASTKARASTGLDKASAAPAAQQDGPSPAKSTAAGTADASSATDFVPPTGVELTLNNAHAHGIVDSEIFGQLLEMDDDDEHGFSKPLAEEYIEQADSTLRLIDDSLAGTDSREAQLEMLSSRGHFLKGSSAALGLNKVKESCEKMQNLGKCKDETGSNDLAADKAMERCKALLPQLKREQAEASYWLKGLCSIP